MAYSKKIAVITYDHPHKKTQEILWRLKASGYTNVSLFALPFVLRKRKNPPIYNHRLSHPFKIEGDVMASNLNYTYYRVTIEELYNKFSEGDYDKILVAGSGLLPKKLVKDFNLINSHPAILPLVRGLDAFKWAIVDQLPIGVTVHIINEEADAGWMIQQKRVDVFSSDTWFDLAMRLFYLEIDLMIEALKQDVIKENLEVLPVEGMVHKRMPPKIEKDLLLYFIEYKKKFVV